MTLLCLLAGEVQRQGCGGRRASGGRVGGGGRLLCSAETGICEMPAEDTSQATPLAQALPTPLPFQPAWVTVGFPSQRSREGCVGGVEGRKLRSHSTEETLGVSGDWRGGWGKRGGQGRGARAEHHPLPPSPGRAGHPGHREGGRAAASQPRRQNGQSREGEGTFGGVQSWKAVGCEGCCLPERGICPKDWDIPSGGPCGWEVRAARGFPRTHWCGREA